MDWISGILVTVASLLLVVAANHNNNNNNNNKDQNLSFSIPVQYSLLSAPQSSSYEALSSSFQVAGPNTAYQTLDNSLENNQQVITRYTDWNKYASSLPQYNPVGTLYHSATANNYPQQNSGGPFLPSTYYGTVAPSYQSTFYQMPNYRRNVAPAFHRNSIYPARYQQTTRPTTTPSFLDSLDFLDYRSPISKQDVIGPPDETGVSPSNPLYALLLPLVLLGISIPAIGFMYTYLHRRRRDMSRNLKAEDIDYYLQLLHRSIQCMQKKNC